MSSFFASKATSQYYYPGIIDLTQPSLYLSAATIAFNPTFWNIVAQNEYHNKTITKILRGNRYLGCYLLAATIFSLGIFRDHVYNAALAHQPEHPLLQLPAAKVVAGILLAAGNVFVLSSMWALGVTGTYLGDYFGILMDHMVEGFPFNVMSDPMYWGSSMSFAGWAIWAGKPAGLFLTVFVVLCYTIALRFEGPFTSKIYAAAARKTNKKDEIAQLQSVDGPAHRTRASTTETPKKKRASPKKKAAAAATENGTPVSASSATATPSGTPSKRSRSKKAAK